MGRIAQSHKYDMKYTDIIEFIPKSDSPKGRVLIYAYNVLDYRPLKSKPNDIYLTVGKYTVSSSVPSILETKIMLNNVA